MPENKTQKTKASVAAFLDTIEDEAKRRDAKIIDKLMREVTGDKPALWGPSIVGYGAYNYRTSDGREHAWMLTGFSPRKNALTLYIMAGFSQYDALLQKLGKHTTGKSCLYIKKLTDVDRQVLRELVTRSVQHLRNRLPGEC